MAIICGLLLWYMPVGDAWTNASFDYLFRFSTSSVTNQVVVILMDNEACAELGQSREFWDRSLHARLFNKLADDGCKLVVPDVFFRKQGEINSDQALADAMLRLSNIVLVAQQAKVAHRDLDSARPTLPRQIFLTAARTNWGVAWLDPNLDGVVRRHWPFPSPGPYPSLPSAAAKLMGAHLAETPTEKWFRYYDFNQTWTSLSYHLALLQPPNYFKGKYVFIGSKPKTPLYEGKDDEFQVPQTRWTGEGVGGVEILVTEYLNLLHDDWLRRPNWVVEVLVFIFTGILVGFTLGMLHRWKIMIAAVILAVALVYAGVSLSEYTNFWFPWFIVVGGQVPCVVIWALVYPRVAVKLIEAEPAAIANPVPANKKTIVLNFPDETPDAPEFTIFKPPIGQGGYGKVWVVYNAIGQWQALKAIYQSKFGANKKPYEAEFKGLQKYKPVSEKHPGLLRIELISKMKPEGYFYYVMELGDPVNPGWEQNPSSYKPRDLENLRKLAEGHRLPGIECLRIVAVLADALDFLHRQGLTHRDIKPSNVIFVQGRPKLADIGLVTNLRLPEHVNTLVGTPGYMPPYPEPTGTVKADIYALGMLLYVISTGKEPEFFPEISSTLIGRTGSEEFIRLDAIILKACQPDVAQRYESTALMLADLQGAAQTH